MKNSNAGGAALRASRFDAAQLKSATRTPQGFLRAPVRATRTGVFTYRLGDGTIRRELRHPDDVFNPDSLATLAGVPLTSDHPNTKKPDVMLVTADNAREFMVGYTGDTVERDEQFVATYVTVTDQAVIEAIESGKRELSCGYTCEKDDERGIYEGQEYDCRQRNIVYNHLAIVDRGRAGPDVRVQLDAADAVQVSTILEAKKMKVVLGGAEYEVNDDLGSAIKKELSTHSIWMQAKLDADERAKNEATRADRAEAKADGLEAECGKLREQVKANLDAADPSRIREAAKARVRVLKVAERVLPSEQIAKLDSLDDKQIMIEVIKAESKTTNLDGKSDAYIEGRFDVIVERLDSDGRQTESLGAKIHETRADGAQDTVEAARQRQREWSMNAWKEKPQAQA